MPQVLEGLPSDVVMALGEVERVRIAAILDELEGAARVVSSEVRPPGDGSPLERVVSRTQLHLIRSAIVLIDHREQFGRDAALAQLTKSISLLGHSLALLRRWHYGERFSDRHIPVAEIERFRDVVESAELALREFLVMASGPRTRKRSWTPPLMRTVRPDVIDLTENGLGSFISVSDPHEEPLLWIDSDDDLLISRAKEALLGVARAAGSIGLTVVADHPGSWWFRVKLWFASDEQAYKLRRATELQLYNGPAAEVTTELASAFAHLAGVLHGTRAVVLFHDYVFVSRPGDDGTWEVFWRPLARGELEELQSDPSIATNPARLEALVLPRLSAPPTGDT